MTFEVTVIIPVYNAEHFLLSAVQSALGQAEVAEVVLIEDGSSDGSLSLCKDLKRSDSRVVLLQHPKGINRGSAASRNLGIKSARSPFIAFLDADDTYLESRFSTTKTIFETHAHAEGVYEAIGAMPTERKHNKPVLTTLKEAYTGLELFKKMSPIGSSGHFSIVGLTVRRSVFEKAGVFDEYLQISEDTEWCVRLAAVCNLQAGNITTPIALRRIHDSNQSTDESFLRKQKPAMALACLDWFVKNERPEEETAEVLRLYFKYRFERLHLSENRNPLQRKWRDIADGLYLWRKYPTLRSYAFLQYHLRLAFKLPVKQHLNYYASE